MTRMIDLESERRIDVALALHNTERLVRLARQQQAQYVAGLIRKAATAVARATGLAALAEAFRRHAVYRRTIDELSQLDDAVLADIGVSRSEIRYRALECSRAAVPTRESWVSRLGAWLRRVREEHRTARELSQLDERMLRDIGIEPGSLRGTAERMASPGHPMVVEAVSAIREAAVVLFAPFKQARDVEAVRVSPVEQTTDKREAA